MKDKRQNKGKIRGELKGKTVLITGGAGSLGSRLAKKNFRVSSKKCESVRY